MKPNIESVLPLGVQLGTERVDNKSTYDDTKQAWVGTDGNIECYSTYITDPQRKEWDD